MRNVMAAGIDYWLIGAVDADAQAYLEFKGVRRCFKAPVGPVELFHLPGKAYLWGQNVWGAATWRKVRRRRPAGPAGRAAGRPAEQRWRRACAWPAAPGRPRPPHWPSPPRAPRAGALRGGAGGSGLQRGAVGPGRRLVQGPAALLRGLPAV
jgi:hypothetical protein